jgi:mannose-1-phosphate guanylyltransferase/phosphomannomutase
VAGMVRAVQADLGVIFDASGERIMLVDNKGRPLSGQQALALFAALVFDLMRDARVAVPVTATSAIEKLAGKIDAVRRTKTGARALMQAAAQRTFAFCGDAAGGYIFPDFSPGLDGLFATVHLLHMLALTGRPLDQIVDFLPAADVVAEQMECPLEAKGAVMRHLIEATAGQEVEMVDGVKVRRGDAWVALIPDPVRPIVHLYSEPEDGARGLVAEFRAVVEQAIARGVLVEQVAAAADEREEGH